MVTSEECAMSKDYFKFMEKYQELPLPIQVFMFIVNYILCLHVFSIAVIHYQVMQQEIPLHYCTYFLPAGFINQKMSLFGKNRARIWVCMKTKSFLCFLLTSQSSRGTVVVVQAKGKPFVLCFLKYFKSVHSLSGCDGTQW